jgi:hypothetical protein
MTSPPFGLSCEQAICASLRLAPSHFLKIVPAKTDEPSLQGSRGPRAATIRRPYVGPKKCRPPKRMFQRPAVPPRTVISLPYSFPIASDFRKNLFSRIPLLANRLRNFSKNHSQPRRLCSRGRRTVKAVSSAPLRTSICPPWAWTIAREMASPRPVRPFPVRAASIR